MTRTILAIFATTFLAAGGCKRVEDYSDLGASALRAAAAQAHYLMNPDMASLFAEAAFTAQFELAHGPMTRLRGGMAARDGKLLFTPENKESKRDEAMGTWMLWNQSGFMMSEALQAYAPVASGSPVGMSAPNPAGSEEIDGQPCRKFAYERGINGLPTAVWRATALRNIPLRVQMTNQGAVITLSLSKARAHAPPAEAFAVPDGFGKYATPEEIAAELVRRRTDAITGAAKIRRGRFGDSPGYDVEDLPSPRRP